MESQDMVNISSDDDEPKKYPRLEHQTRVERKRKPKTSICDYFERLGIDKGKIKAKCSHCSQGCDNTSTACLLNPDNLEDDRKRKALVKMIIIDKLPIATVGTVAFQRLMQSLCPNFSVPSQSTIARDCYAYYLEERKKVKKLFENKQRVCLTVDTWTSEEGLSYMCLTAQFIDENWTLHNKIINFKLVDCDDGDEIGSAIIECLGKWGIENVLTVTTDNASSRNNAVSFLRSRLPNLLSDGKYLHVRCMTHIINLVVKEGFESHNDTIERIQNAVRYVTVFGLDRFNACVVEKELESKTFFCLDWPDRWNTSCDMLKRASEFEKAFDLFETKNPDFKRDLENVVPRPIDWVYARKFASLLEFFKRKAMQSSSTTYVVANQFFSEARDIDAHLHDLSNEVDSRFMPMVNTMREMFTKYWGDQKENYMLYFAVILDPRMKLETIKHGFMEVCKLKKEPNTEQEAVDKMVEHMVEDVLDEFLKLFNEYNESMFPTTNYLDELQKYLDDATVGYNQEFDILQWWKLNTCSYPTLSRMAKDILAIPVSTVASESAFYTDGRVLDPKRSCLPDSLIEALICTHDWIRKSGKDVVDEDLANLDDF